MVCVSRRGLEPPHFMIWHPRSVEVVVHASVHCITAVKLIIFVLVLFRKVTILTSILHTSLKSKLWKACWEASLNTKASTWLDWCKFNSSWIIHSHKTMCKQRRYFQLPQFLQGLLTFFLDRPFRFFLDKNPFIISERGTIDFLGAVFSCFVSTISAALTTFWSGLNGVLPIVSKPAGCNKETWTLISLNGPLNVNSAILLFRCKGHCIKT